MSLTRFRIGFILGLTLLTVPALLARADYLFEPIALGTGDFTRVGDTPDVGTKDALLTINATGVVTFIGEKNTSATTVTGVYTGNGGPLTTVTTETTTVVSGNVTRKELHAPAGNASGVQAFLRYADGEGSSIRSGTANPFTVVSNGNFSNVGNAEIDDNGAVYFFGSLPGISGIYELPAGTTSYVKIARVTSAPSTYDVVRAPFSVSRAGNVAFHAYSGGDSQVEAVYSYIAGTTTVVADNSGNFNQFDDGATINNAGDVAFAAELKTADATTGATRGLFLKKAGGAVTLVVPEKSSAYHGILALSMSNDGSITFNAIDGNTEEGLYLRHPDGTIERVIGTKDKLGGKALNYIYASRNGLNDAGQIAFLAYFKDFTYGVYRASVANASTPPAAADDAVTIRGTTKLNVLANDAAAPGGTLKITAVTPPAKGKAAISGGTAITYTPGKTFEGTDTFTYTVTSNGLTDTATVTVTNPFYALAGSFFQFATQNGAPAGTLTAKLSTGGVVSGTLLVAGKPYTLRGSAGADGAFTQTFKRKPAGTADLVVTLNFADNSGAQVSGAATGDGMPYSFAATPAALTALPMGIEPGAYTVLLPADANASHPRGFGYATATLTAGGNLRLAGKLADGSKLSAGGQLDTQNAVRLFVPLYSNPKGSLTGTLTFASWPSHCGGTLAWEKPAQVKATPLFPGGFSATTVATGSRYVAVKNVRTLSYTAVDAKGDVKVRDGGVTDLNVTVSVTTGDKFTVVGTNMNAVKVSISRTAGLFSGSFLPTGATKALKFYGVVHQGDNHAAGYFLGATGSGSVELVPE